jgi:delta(3,5)-delta(2,4)-dienoyl-CoA isomerase
VMKEALRWAAIVAGKSPVAVQGTKELLNWSRDHGVQDGEPFKPILEANNLTRE